MLDLFRSEVKRHALTLHDGLQALVTNPKSLDRLQGMIPAIQAIKGGAQIIDLEAAVAVAQAMKNVFVAAEKGEVKLDEKGLNHLFKGLEILNHISEVPEEGESAWIDTNAEEINAWVNKAAAPSVAATLNAPEPQPPKSRETEKVELTAPLKDDAPTAAKEPSHEDQQVLLDPAMCELFRSETQNHVAILNDGLLILEQNPATADQLEAMMRAAHSIKGAARIMGLDAAAGIAHAMEDSFVAAQKGLIRFNSGKADILFQGVDMLNRISEHVGEGGPGWLSENKNEIETVKEKIAGIVTKQSDVISQAPGPVNPPLRENEEPVEKGYEEPHRDSPDKPSQKSPENFAADPAMLDLFQAEVETHVAVLNDGLLALENNPGATDQLEALMRAAHSIKGGARIVGLDAAVKVAHAMEDCFVAAQKGVVYLGSEQIDILLRIVDILINIAESIHNGETDWVSRHGEEIDHLMAAMNAILHGEAPIHVSPVDEEIVDVHEQEIASESDLHPVKSEDQRPVPAETSEKTPVVQKPSEMDRTVRVTAAKIERLMGQAGEVVVGAGWLPTFSESLLELKRNHLELLNLLEGLQDAVMNKKKQAQLQELVLQAREKTKACTLQLADRLNQFDIFTGSTAALSDRIYHEVISVRMRPFSDGVQGFPRLVRDLARDLGKKVRLNINGKSTEVDRDILEKLDAPLNHLIRNAVDHGIESPEERIAAGKTEVGLLQLEASHRSGMLMIMVKDDGRGIDLEKLRQKIVQKKLTTQEMAIQMTEAELMEFLFLPGFSTAKNVTEISGRGVGLDVVHNMVHEVGGVVRAVSNPGKGLTFHIELPLTLSVVRTFLVEIAGEPYAFPLARIDRCLELLPRDIDIVEDRQYFRFDNNNIALVDIHNVLELETPLENREKLFVVVLSDRLNAYGLAVDKFLGETDLVVRPLDPRLGRVPDISSVAVMLDGSPVLIFDVEDLVRSIDNLLAGRRLRKLSQTLEAIEDQKKKRILVVDDSFTVREMERKLLESKGYLVDTAVDGVDGWNAIRTGSYDMVISDVDMPRMNGIEFVNQIKRHSELKSIPVIIVSYKDKEEDRLAGLQAGANYYLTKSSFQDDSFIRAAVNLIGEA